jgi:hypothetical protein
MLSWALAALTSTQAAAANPVDAHLERAWAGRGIRPAPQAGPHVLLRRLSLDVLGRLPKPDEIRAFEKDPDPDRLTDAMLASDEAAEFFADQWLRILLVYRFEETLPLKIHFPAFRAWLKEAWRTDLPFADFARALVSDTGDYRQKPASNFILAALEPNEPPHEVTHRVTRIFLGMQIQCARCHDHPFEKTTQEDFWGLTAFFAGVKPKARTTFDGFGVKLMAEPGRSTMAIPDTKAEVPARFPGGARPPEGAAPLESLADWIVSHPRFARTIVNRLWAHYFGRGLVEPVDRFTEASRPSHPALLEALAGEFRAGGTRLRPLARTLLTSKAYRASATPPEGAAPETHAAMILKPLTPVQLLNVLTWTLNMDVFFKQFYAQFSSNKGLPETYRNPEVFRMFLHLYMQGLLAPSGQAPEETRYAGSVRLALKLMNSPDLQGLLKAEWGRMAELLRRETSAEGRVREIFLTLLSRPPSAEELSRHLKHVEMKKASKESFEDVYWVLLNSGEFMFRP